MDVSLQTEYINQVNNVRAWLYGAENDVKLVFLRMNSKTSNYEVKLEVTTDFMIDFTAAGRASIELATGAYDQLIYESSHVVWKNKVYELVLPVKPSEGPFPLWAFYADPTRERFEA